MDIEKLKEYSNSDDTLRPYQHENKERVYEAWKTCQSVMLQMPTGTGKTRLFVSIIKDIFHYSRDTKHAYKVLILVHRTELIDQIDLELGIRYGLAHGIIQSGNKERKEYPIQIASVQTLSRRLENWTDKLFDFVIIDEAHHTTAQSYQAIIKAFPDAKLLGVTATPCRLSGEGFTGTYDKLILSDPISTFIEDGYLSDYFYYSVPKYSFIQREINGITKFSNGDYAEQEMERVCNNDRIRAQVLDTYLRFANGKKGIVYTINKRHNQKLCTEFNSHGIKAVAIDSDTPKEIRQQYIEDFKKSKIKIIFNVNLFTEGFDCPDIEFVQLARPTKSLALFLQQVGRGLRISENKEKTIFLDNVGLYNKFGMPRERRQWERYFQGKDENDSFIKDEHDLKQENDSSVKRTRNQNLTEGNEEVFLIETPDEKAYKEQRIELFWNLLEEYNKIHVDAINTLFQGNRGWKLNGLCVSLTPETYCDENWRYYHLKFQFETSSLKAQKENDQWSFYKYDDNGNIVESITRYARDYQELAFCIEKHLEWQRKELIKKDLKLWMKRICNSEFMDEEIDFLIANTMNRGFSITPDHYNDEQGNVNIVQLWRSIFYDNSHIIFGNKGFKRFIGLFLFGIFRVTKCDILEVAYGAKNIVSLF